MAENEQNVQTPITINVNGNASNPNDTALNIMLAWINRLNGTLGQIKTIVEDRQNLSVADDIRVVSEDTLKKVRKSVSDAKRTILKKMSEEKGVLTEELDALHKSVEGLEEKFFLHQKHFF